VFSPLVSAIDPILREGAGEQVRGVYTARRVTAMTHDFAGWNSAVPSGENCAMHSIVGAASEGRLSISSSVRGPHPYPTPSFGDPRGPFFDVGIEDCGHSRVCKIREAHAASAFIRASNLSASAV